MSEQESKKFLLVEMPDGEIRLEGSEGAIKEARIKRYLAEGGKVVGSGESHLTADSLRSGLNMRLETEIQEMLERLVYIRDYIDSMI